MRMNNFAVVMVALMCGCGTAVDDEEAVPWEQEFELETLAGSDAELTYGYGQLTIDYRTAFPADEGRCGILAEDTITATVNGEPVAAIVHGDWEVSTGGGFQFGPTVFCFQPLKVVAHISMEEAIHAENGFEVVVTDGATELVFELPQLAYETSGFFIDPGDLSRDQDIEHVFYDEQCGDVWMESIEDEFVLQTPVLTTLHNARFTTSTVYDDVEYEVPPGDHTVYVGTRVELEQVADPDAIRFEDRVQRCPSRTCLWTNVTFGAPGEFLRR